MVERDIVVVGGSAGGIRAIRAMLAELPEDFPAAIFVVLHTSPESPRLLPDMLAVPGAPPVRYAVNGERFERGIAYIAPPDLHMLVEAGGHIRLAFGPKENRFRPAIDPLFRSAALAFGPRAAGVLLSGGLDDGVAGLAAIKAAGPSGGGGAVHAAKCAESRGGRSLPACPGYCRPVDPLGVQRRKRPCAAEARQRRAE